MKQILFRSFVVIVLIGGLISWFFNQKVITKPSMVGNGPEGKLTKTITLTAVGDVVMHMPIVNAAYQPADGAYDFRPVFAELKESLTQADFTTAVLETTLAGEAAKYTGYPQFNSPSAIANALQWAGVDLVFTAHNHSLDRGASGLQTTLGYLDQIRLPFVGSRYQSQQNRYRIIDVKGVRLAFMAYTTTTNGIKLPPGSEWMINLYNEQSITEDIAAIKKAGADCIIMALHTGVEYQRVPTMEQQKIVDWLLTAGVDVILGSHVHVVEPIEFRKITDPASGAQRDCLVVYSLGNLLSNQRWRYSDYGLQINLTLQKQTGCSGVQIASVHYIPLWVNRYLEEGRYHYQIVKLRSPIYLVNNSLINEATRRRIQEVWSETKELVENWQNQKEKGSQKIMVMGE